jgi:hypothetical protein
MPTFREMQDRINLDYLNRTDLGNETKRAIIRAVKHYEKTRFWFNMTSTALAIGTASSTVAIPSDFLALEFATVRDSSLDSIVTMRSFDRIAYKNQNTSLSGVVAEICYWRDTLNFTPKPSSATTLTIYYTHAFPALSADTDTNPWTSAAEDLIVHHATADMLANVLRVTDGTQIASHKTWEQEAYTMLKAGNDLRTGFGMDAAASGSQHGQAPKKPGSGLP